jgi:hypothetical protein
VVVGVLEGEVAVALGLLEGEVAGLVLGLKLSPA